MSMIPPNANTSPANIPLDTAEGGLYGIFRFPDGEAMYRPRMADPHSSPASWETILHALPCGYFIVNPQGLISSLNPACVQLLGLDASRLQNKPALEAIAFWKNTPFAKALEGMYASQTLTGTITFELPTSDDRWLAVHVGPMPKDAGGGLLVTLQDATELVRLKHRLRWTEYQASIGKLARGIAHELNKIGRAHV